MVAFDVDCQISLCRNLERVIDTQSREVEEAQRLVDEANARLQELRADIANLDPIDILSRRALEPLIAEQEGRTDALENLLRLAQDRFQELMNAYEIDDCRRVL